MSWVSLLYDGPSFPSAGMLKFVNESSDAFGVQPLLQLRFPVRLATDNRVEPLLYHFSILRIISPFVNRCVVQGVAETSQSQRPIS